MSFGPWNRSLASTDVRNARQPWFPSIFLKFLCTKHRLGCSFMCGLHIQLLSSIRSLERSRSKATQHVNLQICVTNMKYHIV
uniref:Uncharacterized protein n=1 Tax=Anguilla anguilla TaxID=7936 RepID=A0A0E9PS33_ANGAN